MASIILVLCGLAGCAVSYCFGYEAGVKDTEVRWREAVGRADDARGLHI